jgi:hypothetical protein
MVSTDFAFGKLYSINTYFHYEGKEYSEKFYSFIQLLFYSR